VPAQFIVQPQIQGDVVLGRHEGRNRVYLGKLGETGPFRKVWFDATKEFVAMILGKRGSGKSYTLGVLLEGLCTQNSDTSISQVGLPRAVLLLDPMGNFWTSAIPVTADGPPKVREQLAAFDGWDCTPEAIRVRVWLPDGYAEPTDFPDIAPFRIPVSDLDAQDWADILGLDPTRDPQGVLLEEAFYRVTEEGWHDGYREIPANPAYGLDDLIRYVEQLVQAGPPSEHASQTVRALLRSLRSYARRPLFGTSGTPLTDLLQPGVLSVLMLPLRLGADLRRVLTRVLMRRILREREVASQIRQRLDVEPLGEKDRRDLEEEEARRIPKAVVAIDEAQELVGDEGQRARQAIEEFCLLGRNYGLSLLLATQRPTATAASSKVRSQVDTFLIHRLLSQEDIDLASRSLLSMWPQEVRDRHGTLDLTQLLRALKQGQLLATSSEGGDSRGLNRACVVTIRPRVTVHGGEVEL